MVFLIIVRAPLFGFVLGPLIFVKLKLGLKRMVVIQASVLRNVMELCSDAVGTCVCANIVRIGGRHLDFYTKKEPSLSGAGSINDN